MKFILPTIMLLMMILNKNISLLLMLMTYILMLIIMLFSSKHLMMMMNLLFMDTLTLIMLMLTLMSVILIMLSSSQLLKINKTMIPILITLMLTFISMNMFMFYMMFEIVLIPTMILITMNGKQPERLQASIYLMMYTIMASLPLLMSIIMLNNSSFMLSNINMLKYNMILFLMLAFLVKMPMYFTHLWLPKAHVEAPLEGSMILAAILLKLGGYGIIRFAPFLITNINNINYWIISISLIGATATSMNCIRQKDLKSLIAYSSVAHMSFVLTGLFTFNMMGLYGAIIMMLAHGLTSSALFLLVNDLYFKFHSRNIMMLKGLLIMSPNITFWWFMFMSMNISAPPTINTFSEIMMMSNLLMWSTKSMLMIFMMSIMTATFSMMMFVNIIHNKNMSYSFLQTPMKIHLSLFIHLIPMIILIMKMEMMFM